MKSNKSSNKKGNNNNNELFSEKVYFNILNSNIL